MQPHGTSKKEGASLSACAVGDDGTVVSGFIDGKVLIVKPDGKYLPVSELVQFSVPSGALDLSINATSQFVALLGGSHCLSK